MPTPPARPPPTTPLKLLLEPDAATESAARVTRFVVTPSPGHTVAPGAFWFFAGDLSDYHASRIARGQLPSALLERQIPTLAWFREDSIVVAPTQALTPGDRFSLALLGTGLVVSIRIADGSAPIWSRLWPPSGSASGGQYSVYCGDQVLSQAAAGTVLLEPGPFSATVAPGADDAANASEPCIHLSATTPLPESMVLMPPPMAEGALLDPEPLGTFPARLAAPLECTRDESAFGPGCATVQDDRIRLRVPAEPLLWIVDGSGERWVRASSASTQSLVMTGLAPDSDFELSPEWLDLSGTKSHMAVWLSTLPPRSHVVINEVLANPCGSEPRQEWVELFNAGAAQADLSEYRLFDNAGETVLPHAILPAGGFALVVREDYRADSPDDPPPSSGTLLLRVPQIGKNGLSNTGEALRLVAPTGEVLSRFPAIAALKAGVSVIRRTPEAPDDDAASFLLEPGGSSSPGAPNWDS